MVRRMTGKIAFLNYWPYGCHCGLGGKGTPKDATDWQSPEGTDTEPSLFLLPTADKGSWCERELCACDKEVALCLKQNLDSYNKRLRYYWRSRCTGHIPTC
ncbi:phospholipase A2 group IID [Cricetulus griseus]